MARTTQTEPLLVYINGVRVGTLRKSSGILSFQYGIEWLADERAYPISLSLPLTDQAYTGDKVLFVFENMLPDNIDIRERIAARKKAEGKDAFSLLAVVGRDCVGAMQFLPEGTEPSGQSRITGHEVDDKQIAAILRDLASTPLGMGEDDEDFRISIAGAQEKTALLRHDGKWLVPHGTTPTTHIFKKPIGIRNDGIDFSLSCENEHFCLTLLSKLGFLVNDTVVQEFEDQKAIVVRRFDRRLLRSKGIRRLPQEDFCQALSIPSSMKYQKDGGPGYEQIFNLLLASDVAERDRTTMATLMVVFWLLAASDGHSKNFSIFLGPSGTFRLTPIYDVMSIQPLFDAGQIADKKVRVAMSVGEKNHYIVSQIAVRHFFETAQKCNISKETITEILNRLIDTSGAAIDEALNAMPTNFPEHIGSSIAVGYMSRLELLKGVFRQA